MALPLLFAEHIQPSFNNLRDSLPDDVDERVTALVTYANDNWISSRLWPPNGPGSERARERISQGPIGRFAPRSELARERTGSAPYLSILTKLKK